MTKQVSETLETTTPNTEETTAQETPKLLTQEQVDHLVGQARIKEREKYKGFDEYKAAAEELEKIKLANMTELEKLQERNKTLEAELNQRRQQEQIQAWRDEVAQETGVPADVLFGTTKEEMAEHAKALKAYLPDNTKPVVGSDGFAPTGTVGKKSTRELFAEAVENAFTL